MSDFFGFFFKICGLAGKDELSQALTAENLYLTPGIVNLIIIVSVLLFFYKLIDRPANANFWRYFLFALLGLAVSILSILLYLNYEFTQVDYEFTFVNALFFCLTYNVFFFLFFYFILSIPFSRLSTNCKNIPFKVTR